MQTQHQSKGSDLDSLEELLANFNLMQAAKPLGCSQFELALAAVLNASKVVGGTLPQSARVRASSLPVGIPSYAPSTPSTAAGSPVQAVPLYRSRVNGSLTPPNLKLASPQSDRPPIKTCLYKTEMCRGWEASGRCRYGSKCQFAHGAQELQPVQRHPKYKTEICRTFAQTGSCRYGKRCRFIHSDTSTDLSLLPNTPPQTDHHTLYQSLGLEKEPCSQHCCSSIAPASKPDSRSYASPQAIPQYLGLHPATYQDHFLRPASVLVTSQAAHFETSPYTIPYSSPAVPVTSDATNLKTLPYTSPYSSSTSSEHAYSLLAHLPAAGNVDATNSDLLGSGYYAQEPAGLMLGGTAGGGQLETSPRGVLEYAAMQGCGHFSREGVLSHSQTEFPGSFGSSLYETFTTCA